MTLAAKCPLGRFVSTRIIAAGTIKRSDFGTSYGVRMVSDKVDLKINAALVAE